MKQEDKFEYSVIDVYTFYHLIAGLIAGIILAATHPALRLLFYPLFVGFEIVENLMLLPKTGVRRETWQNSLADILTEVFIMEVTSVLVAIFLPSLALW
ncbi:MAG: hypothetical protein ACTSVI_14195 [Promethearchaeota archaeon]